MITKWHCIKQNKRKGHKPSFSSPRGCRRNKPCLISLHRMEDKIVPEETVSLSPIKENVAGSTERAVNIPF